MQMEIEIEREREGEREREREREREGKERVHALLQGRETVSHRCRCCTPVKIHILF